MLHHPTLEKLKALRLTGMREALIEQLEMRDIETLDFEERLGLSECVAGISGIRRQA